MLHLTLFYQGQLRAQQGRCGVTEHKHELRTAFHYQLSEFWRKHPPLKAFENPVVASPNFVVKNVGPFRFKPLVSSEYAAVADINLFMLRAGATGEILKGGDIDNRLKTLFDALSIPSQDNQLPSQAPGDDQVPFYCLLEDDRLVSSVRVETAPLLRKDIEPLDVVLFIQVTVKTTHVTRSNMWI